MIFIVCHFASPVAENRYIAKPTQLARRGKGNRRNVIVPRDKMNISRPVMFRLPFSSRKSFLGVDRYNGHATVKPINLQIRCEMNY